MTPSDFEWGQTVAKVKETEHRLRSLRTAVNLLDHETEDLRTQVSRLKIEIRTTLSVLGVVGSVLAYLLR